MEVETWRTATAPASGPARRQPVLLDPEDLPDYHRRIGRNTNYIIHPDEILADNFATW